jgi:hypothetical protein
MQQSIVMYECTIGRVMNSKNLGTRIVENIALDKKIWALEALGAKWSIQEVMGGYLEFLE